MEVLAREEWGEFVDYVFEEVECGLLSGTHDDIFDAPDDAGRDGVAPARQPRIGCDGGQLMTRDFQLGDDFDMAGCGVGYNVFHFVLRVEAAMTASVAFRPPCADLGQLGVFLDFDAPALVVGQVPVERVNLVV